MRNPRTLGFTLVAAIAIGFVAASPASATPFKFKSTAANPILTGKQHNPTADVLVTDSGVVTCASVTYTGTQPGTESNELELQPAYSGCFAFGFVVEAIHVNNCKFRFTTGTKEGSNYEGSVHIVCPTKPIEITAAFGCVVTIPGGQTPKGTITYTNLGAGATQEVTVDMNLWGIKYEEHDSDSFPCPNDTDLTSDGEYIGSALITGENVFKEHIGIFVQ